MKIEPMKMKLKHKIVNQLNACVRVKTFGVHANSSLNWKDENECDKKKLELGLKCIKCTCTLTYAF